MPLEVQFTDKPLGHKVQGLDINKLDDVTFHEIDELWIENGVIVIAGQKLTAKEQIAYSRRFGPLETFPIKQYNLPDAQEILVVSNIVENGQPVGLADAGRHWHTDMWYTPNPPRGSILYAVEIPSKDGEVFGDTMFISMANAYDTLPPELKKIVDGKSAIYSSAHSLAWRRKHVEKTEEGRASGQAAREAHTWPDVSRPMARIHPRSGRTCLFIGGEAAIATIEGFDEEESQDIVQRLLAHAMRPDNLYRHKWTMGDLMMWDNFSVMHNAVGDFDLPLRRRMHRTTVEQVLPQWKGVKPAS